MVDTPETRELLDSVPEEHVHVIVLKGPAAVLFDIVTGGGRAAAGAAGWLAAPFLWAGKKLAANWTTLLFIWLLFLTFGQRGCQVPEIDWSKIVVWPFTPPKPDEPPQPVWGPLDKVVVIYESSKWTGKEPVNDVSVRDALSLIVPKGSDQRPQWRIWDQDEPGDRYPGWATALAKAREAFKAGPGTPILCAFDAQDRLKEPTMDASEAVTPEDLAAKIRELGVNPR
jgi:hypothetical protein